MSKSKRSLGWVLVAWTAKLGFALFAIATPVLGVWIGSSLAKAFDGPVWLPFAAGALCFPVLPLLWEGVGQWRRRKSTKPAILTLFDRLLLRTLSINLVFVGGLLGLYPSTVFTALSEHGDWMLDGQEMPWVRDTLHAAADRMQWLHELTHPNAYDELIDPDAKGEDVDVSDWGDFSNKPSEGDIDGPKDVFRNDAWPFKPEVHPLVRAIPADQQATPEAVGRYFAEHEVDPIRRLEAVHDYVADRTAYDVEALRTMTFPPQDAQTVLDTRIAVCAGYAQLVKAIGDAAGLEVVVVVGKTRGESDLGHAWNAAKIDGKWYLLDSTWDAGSVGDAFTKRFSTDYLMTPPDVFLYDHFPDDPKWQLRDEPLSMGDFLRRPDLEPKFFTYGFELVSPTRSNVTTVGRSVSLTLKNPNNFRVHAQSYAGNSWDAPSTHCEVERSGELITCPLQQKGPNLIVMFGPDNMNMGQVLVTAQ